MNNYFWEAVLLYEGKPPGRNEKAFSCDQPLWWNVSGWWQMASWRGVNKHNGWWTPENMKNVWKNETFFKIVRIYWHIFNQTYLKRLWVIKKTNTIRLKISIYKALKKGSTPSHQSNAMTSVSICPCSLLHCITVYNICWTNKQNKLLTNSYF